MQGFERYRFTANDGIFVSFTRYGMAFSTSSVRLLGYPLYAEVYLDREGKRFAITPGEKGDPDARAFVRNPEAKNASFVRWNERRLLHDLIDLGELNLGEKGVRVPGEYVESEKMIIYDLTKAEAIRGKGRALHRTNTTSAS